MSLRLLFRRPAPRLSKEGRDSPRRAAVAVVVLMAAAWVFVAALVEIVRLFAMVLAATPL